MDYSLYKTINGLSGHSLPDALFKLLADDVPAILVVLVAMVFLVPWTRRRWQRRSGAVLATAPPGLRCWSISRSRTSPIARAPT